MARILHFSDIHFGGEIEAAVEAAIHFAHDDGADLVLITGDLTLNGLHREFAAAQTWLHRLPRPWLATPGNHDTPYWNLPLRALTPFARYERFIGAAHGETVVTEDVSVQTVNTARGAQPRFDWSKGAINLHTCRRVVERFDAGRSVAARLVACHHPLVEATGAPVTGGVHRGEAAAAILADGGVDAVLTGHVHNPFALPLAFADRKTYAIGAGTLSQRLRGSPASFNRVTIDEDTLLVEALGWAGSKFEPYRTWALPRRVRP